jgi:hypothetical protein
MITPLQEPGTLIRLVRLESAPVEAWLRAISALRRCSSARIAALLILLIGLGRVRYSRGFENEGMAVRKKCFGWIWLDLVGFTWIWLDEPGWPLKCGVWSVECGMGNVSTLRRVHWTGHLDWP